MKDLLIFSKIAIRLTGIRFLYLFLLMTVAALLEGLSVSLFLPLLQGVETQNQFNSILSAIFKVAGLPFTFLSILITMLFIFVIRSGFLVAQGSYVGKIIADVLIGLRQSIIRKIFSADYQYLISKEVGYLHNAVITEFNSVSIALKSYMTLLVKFAFIFVYTALPLVINFTLTIVTLIIGLPTYFLLKKINLLTKNYSIRQSQHQAKLQGLVIQALRFLKYFKATNTHGSMLSQIDTECDTLGVVQYRTNTLQAVSLYAFEPVVVLLLAGLLYYQVEILGKEVIEIVFLMYLLRRSTSGILSIQQSYRKFLASIGSIGVFQNLDEELRLNQESITGDLACPDFNRPIRFAKISFAYAGNADVLKNINLEIHPKSSVAFVGGSGSGKTTLINLVTGLIKPVSGTLFLGDMRYDELDLSALRSGMGYITQENVILNDSIQNNMTLWDPAFDAARMHRAAESARIHDFITSLPEGYETQVGDNGINLSGGQRQRMMIARELYRQSKILIFDESTSALDTETEQEIQRNINALKGKSTIIMIAHRLSTVANCDMICVLKDGQIVERGNYDELYRLNGEFTRMVHRQSEAMTG